MKDFDDILKRSLEGNNEALEILIGGIQKAYMWRNDESSLDESSRPWQLEHRLSPHEKEIVKKQSLEVISNSNSNPYAMTLAGAIYETEYDHSSAIEFYEKAILLNCVLAMFLRIGVENWSDRNAPTDTLDKDMEASLYERIIELSLGSSLSNTLQAMLHLANLCEGGECSTVNGDRAIYLYRKICFLSKNTPLYLDYYPIIQGYLLEYSMWMGELTPTASYHRAFVLNKELPTDLIEQYPHDLIRLLEQDEFLSMREKCVHFTKILKKHPKIISEIQDQKIIDFIGICLIEVHNILVERGKIKEAIHYLKVIPAQASSRADACYNLATHLYFNALNKTKGIALARPYLEEGCRLDDAACETFYIFMLKSADKSTETTCLPLSSETLEEVKQSYEKILQIQSQQLEQFIKKHKLDNLAHWHQQVKWGGGKQVTCRLESGGLGPSITVPHEIADMLKIIDDPILDTQSKLIALSKCKIDFKQQIFKLFNRTLSTEQCISAATQLDPNISMNISNKT